jgi:hypothetical protein
VPGIGRQMDDPWAWKGCFYDTDYSFVAHVSTEGDQLIRIWGPDGSRGDGYQTEAVPGIEPVPGGQVKITRDESQKLTIYEIGIPRRELALFDPQAGRCRFGFILYNCERAAGGSMNWSDAAGVFDHWRSSGSYPPTWLPRLPCQTVKRFWDRAIRETCRPVGVDSQRLVRSSLAPDNEEFASALRLEGHPTKGPRFLELGVR